MAVAADYMFHHNAIKPLAMWDRSEPAMHNVFCSEDGYPPIPRSLLARMRSTSIDGGISDPVRLPFVHMQDSRLPHALPPHEVSFCHPHPLRSRLLVLEASSSCSMGRLSKALIRGCRTVPDLLRRTFRTQGFRASQPVLPTNNNRQPGLLSRLMQHEPPFFSQRRY